MYEFLMQWLKVGKKEFSLDELRFRLELRDQYQRIDDFKRRIIDTAVKEINDHANLNVSYTQRKTGRVVTHLIFTFSEKNKPQPKINDAYIKKHARPGESWDEAKKRLLSKS